MQIYIEDDFDLNKILRSGQCFRAEEENGTYRFITGSSVLWIRGVSDTEYEVSCGSEEWESVWTPYFDLGRDYSGIRRAAAGRNCFIDHVMEIGKGLRILRQDPWEMLLTFIISQRKSIPAIRTSVRMLSDRYGTRLESAQGISCFPTAAQLCDVTEEELRACALGYRVPYIQDAVRCVESGEVDLVSLADRDDETLLKELQKVHGVGKKVANCIGLFGYGRTSCVPVDVWISRAIEEECGGSDPFECYGGNAGIMQQYVFYYKSAVVRNGRGKSVKGRREKPEERGRKV